jgi:glycosyltransferase involved in cell wall biosynthesis
MGSRSRSRRILLVTNRFGWGGAEKQLEHLAAGLAANGHAVVLLALNDRVVDVSWLERAGVRLVQLGADGRFAKLRSVRAIARFARAAEVVHCTGWDATLWGRLGAALARTPCVITEHTPGRVAQASGIPGFAGEGTIAMHNHILDRVTYATIAVGAWQRELLESEGVRGESIVHIPNGVPVADLRRRADQAEGRAALGIPADARVLIEVARFAPQKGQSVALRTVARLRERLGDVRLLLVGGGAHEEAVREEARQMGADWAQFLGFREEVEGLVRLADLSILPSEGEGLPMTLIESVALGTPIVATDVGDVGWFLRKTGAGVCVPPFDEAAFTAACGDLLADPERRAALAAAADASAAQFDSATMVRRYEEVLEAAIAKAPLPVRLGDG